MSDQTKSGIVHEITDNLIKVKICSESACSSCHARSACTALDSQDRIIEIEKMMSSDYSSLSVGQNIHIAITTKQSFFALCLGYVFPLILVTLILSLGSVVIKNEGILGLLSLGVLIPYYAVLYLKRSSLKKVFSVRIL